MHLAIYDAGVASAKAKASYEALQSTVDSYTTVELRKMAELELRRINY